MHLPTSTRLRSHFSEPLEAIGLGHVVACYHPQEWCPSHSRCWGRGLQGCLALLQHTPPLHTRISVVPVDNTRQDERGLSLVIFSQNDSSEYSVVSICRSPPMVRFYTHGRNPRPLLEWPHAVQSIRGETTPICGGKVAKKCTIRPRFTPLLCTIKKCKVE